MKRIYELFGKSPFTPLMEHMKIVEECVGLVPKMMDYYLKQDYEGAKKVFKKICKVEHEADEIKKEIRERLPKTFMMPVARADLLSYLKQQDNIADAAEDCGALCNLKELKLPKKLHDSLNYLLDENIKAVYIGTKITNAFKELTESGFSGVRADKVSEIIEDVEHQEWVCDKAQMTFAKELFRHEKDMDPVTIMLWFNIVRAISKMSNAAESVGVQMRIMLAKR